MTGEPQFIEAGGQRLEYAWVGEDADARAADEAALVFLHEGLGCVAMWRDFPETVSHLTGRQGFVYSRAGFGRSDPIVRTQPDEFHEREAYKVLPAILDAARIKAAILIGHSDGGTIALMAAGRDPRIQGVVSMAAHVFNEDITRAGIRDARVAWETTDLRAKLTRYHGDNVDNAFFGWNDTWLRDDFRDWNVEACLAAVTCPVLVVQGADDQYGSPAQVEAIATGVSGPSEVFMIPDCGHAPHHEAPETLFPCINDFIARLAL